jgi:beta-lactam-binding protein with PASTA domain
VVPDPVESNEAENTVIDISPTGTVEVGKAITVTYSTGPGTVTIPNGLAGQSEQQVREALIGLGLVPQSAGKEPSDQPAGTVLSLSPDSGDVPAGSTVSYVVSSGPEKQEETPEPTQTETPAAKAPPTSGPDKAGKP